jgi:hypothetical protein
MASARAPEPDSSAEVRCILHLRRSGRCAVEQGVAVVESAASWQRCCRRYSLRRQLATLFGYDVMHVRDYVPRRFATAAMACESKRS